MHDSPLLPHDAQSSLVQQGERQVASTHSRPPPQSLLLWQAGSRAVLGAQMPPTQVSPAVVQSLGCEQPAWQTPLMQVEPLPQSLA
jgi:hypothetical protein